MKTEAFNYTAMAQKAVKGVRGCVLASFNFERANICRVLEKFMVHCSVLSKLQFVANSVIFGSQDDL